MRAGDIVFDSTAKDYVKITNGIPIVGDDGKETRDLEPTEGVVIRHVLGDGLFWTYISIAGHRLSVTRVTEEEWKTEMAKTKGRV